MLSALVSGLIHADQLIILTDINGFMTLIHIQTLMLSAISIFLSVTDDLLQIAGGSGSNVGTGGMKSKLLAAKTALTLGVKVFIGTGKGKDKLLTILRRKW